jgi:hypothetical protein
LEVEEKIKQLIIVTAQVFFIFFRFNLTKS